MNKNIKIRQQNRKTLKVLKRKEEKGGREGKEREGKDPSWNSLMNWMKLCNGSYHMPDSC